MECFDGTVFEDHCCREVVCIHICTVVIFVFLPVVDTVQNVNCFCITNLIPTNDNSHTDISLVTAVKTIIGTIEASPVLAGFREAC